MSKSLLALLLLGLVLVAQATKLDLAQGAKVQASGSDSDSSDDSDSGSSDDSDSGSSDDSSDDSGSGSGSGDSDESSGDSESEEDSGVKLGKQGITIKKGHHAGHTIVIQNKNTVHSVSKGGGDMAAIMAMNQANNKRQEESEKRADQRRKDREEKEEARKAEKKKEEESRKNQEQKKKQDALERQKKAANEKEKKAEMKGKRDRVAAKERETKAKERHNKKLAEAKNKHNERGQKAARQRAERTAKNRARERTAKNRNRARERAAKNRARERAAKRNNFRLYGRLWRNYGYSYEPARCFRWSIYAWVHGLVRGHHGFVGWLPAYCRPRFGRLIFSVIKGGRPARVDVLRDGRVYHIAGGGGGWMSLSGIHFSVVHDPGLHMVWGWRPYGYGYRHTGVRNVHNLCMVTGLIRSGRWGYFARMPGWCWPNKRLIFSANNHAHTTRVDTLRNGYILRSGGYAYHHWVSLDGISFYRFGGHRLRLYAGWRNYGYYRGASVAKIGRVCLVSGLIKNGHWRNPITVLPHWCRPRQRLIFGGNVHMSSARIDVVPSGHVYYINGKQRWNWLSLDGVKFYTRN